MKAGVVERWNQHAGPFGIRQDLFGFIDVIAIDPSRGSRTGAILAVQACPGPRLSDHLAKITTTQPARDNALAWLRAGGRIEVWAWRKTKLHRGGKAIRWTPRVVELSMPDFELSAPTHNSFLSDPLPRLENGHRCPHVAG